VCSRLLYMTVVGVYSTGEWQMQEVELVVTSLVRNYLPHYIHHSPIE
jgi:hypothetical protein